MVKLAGVWTLISFDLMLNNTSFMQPNGPDPLGKLVITSEGYLSVLITTPETAIPLPNGTKWTDGTDAELAALARPMVTYCGKYNTSYVGQQLVLTTHVDVSLNPAMIGTPQPRNVSFVEENGKNYMLLKPQGTVPLALPVRPNLN
jgi:Lipocalin-like domain